MIPEHQRDRKSKTGAAINEVPTSSNATSDLTDGSDRTSGFLFGAKTMPELSFSSLAASGSFGLGNKTALQGRNCFFIAFFCGSNEEMVSLKPLLFYIN